VEQEKYEDKTVKATLGGKERNVKVRVIPITWEGKEDFVEIFKWPYGMTAEFTQKFLNMQMIGEFQKTTIEIKEMQIETVLMGLCKAPFPITKDYISWELDGELGEYIAGKIEEYNHLTGKKKRN